MASIDPNTGSNVNAIVGVLGLSEVIIHYVAEKGLPVASDGVNAVVIKAAEWFDGLNAAFGLTPEVAGNGGAAVAGMALLNWLLLRFSSEKAGSLAIKFASIDPKS